MRLKDGGGGRGWARDEILEHRIVLMYPKWLLDIILSFLCVCMAHSLVALVRNDTESE